MCACACASVPKMVIVRQITNGLTEDEDNNQKKKKKNNQLGGEKNCVEKSVRILDRTHDQHTNIILLLASEPIAVKVDTFGKIEKRKNEKYKIYLIVCSLLLAERKYLLGSETCSTIYDTLVYKQ